MPNNAFVTVAQATVIGEPTNRQTTNNQTRLNFRIGVPTTKPNPDQKASFKYLSDIYNVTVIGKYAESLMQNLHNKTKVYVDGELQMAEYDDRNGNHHIEPSITARRVNILFTGNNQGNYNNNNNYNNNGYNNNGYNNNNYNNGNNFTPVEDDEEPF